jgi:hypothetical protein
MANNDSGGLGLLGVLIGVLIVVALAYFMLGDRLGLRTSGSDVNVRVESPNKAPAPTPTPAPTPAPKNP